MAEMVLLVEMVAFLLFVVGFNLRRGLRGGGLVGESPIHPILFGAGKLCMAVCWFLVPAHALGLGADLARVPASCGWASVALLSGGTALAVVALVSLGERSPFGLPAERMEMKTDGIYAMSRNPLYLGFYLVTLASVVLFPHPLNLFAGIVGVLMHHRAVLAEERFLRAEHGAVYEAYVEAVPRYL